jgi:hypothetical protein
MSLVYPGPVTAPTKNLGSAFPDSLRSILVTLLGSAVSAAIGFVVQEFLRSRSLSERVRTEVQGIGFIDRDGEFVGLVAW